MAWQVGVAQTVPLVCYLDGVPTAPTAPIVTTVNVEGAGFVAATNAATIEGDAGEVSVLLTADEMGAWGFVRVTGDNGSQGIQPFTGEADYTATRADKLDDISDAAAIATAVEAALAAAHGDGDWDATAASGGATLAIVASISRLISDPEAAIELIRGDDHVLVYRFRDVTAGTWVDLTGSTLTLTIRHPHDREVAAPGDPIAEIEGVVAEDAVNGDSVTFTITATHTAGMEIDQDYDYDVAGVNEAVTTTYVRGTARRTWDVGR